MGKGLKHFGCDFLTLTGNDLMAEVGSPPYPEFFPPYIFGINVRTTDGCLDFVQANVGGITFAELLKQKQANNQLSEGIEQALETLESDEETAAEQDMDCHEQNETQTVAQEKFNLYTWRDVVKK